MKCSRPIIGTVKRRALTLALCGGYFLVLLDVTVVNVALPSIGGGLHASGARLAWIVDAYTVVLAALLLSAGAIGDLLGHRRVVVLGFAGFGLASIGCAVAPGLPMLVGGRALQGLCAALMLPGTLALLTESAADDQARTRLVGVWAAVGGCALPAGPFVGGLLTQDFGWRSVFWLNVPVIAAALVPVLRAPRARPKARRVDWAGAGTLVVVVGTVVAAIIEARENPGIAVVSAMLAVVSAVALVVVERRTDHPLLTVPGNARRPLAVACGVAGVMNLCSVGALFLLTQLFQDVHRLGPLETGLLLLPAMAPLPLLGTTGGKLAHRIGPWRASALGLAMAAVGLAVLAATSFPLLLIGFVLWGSGLGLLGPAIVSAALRTLPDAPGTASGASNTARQVGAAVGVALFSALAGPAGQAGFAQRSGWVFAGCAVAFLLAAVLSLRAGTVSRASSRVPVAPR